MKLAVYMNLKGRASDNLCSEPFPPLRRIPSSNNREQTLVLLGTSMQNGPTIFTP